MVHPPNTVAERAQMPSNKPEKPSFSIDEFIGEIEKAEAETLNKRLPQERLKNKRALDNAARRAAEAAGNAGKLVPPTAGRRTAQAGRGRRPHRRQRQKASARPPPA